jgi:hypothetical protein
MFVRRDRSVLRDGLGAAAQGPPIQGWTMPILLAEKRDTRYTSAGMPITDGDHEE